MRIVVTDGESRAALATVRTLGAKGHTLHVVATQARSLAGASRHTAAEHVLCDPGSEPARWAAALERLAADLNADALFPISEISLGSLYASDVPARCSVICPDRSAYELATDKHALLGRGAALGIDVPRGVLIEDPTQLSKLPSGFEYPVVLKPRRSRWLAQGRWETGEARIVHGPGDLQPRCGATAPGAWLLQEYVHGHGEAIFLLASGGRPLVQFAHRRLREKPPTGGVSVLRQSIEPDAQLLEGSRRLVEDLDWTGVAMIEFRRAPDGRAFLMEMNPRLWGSVQLAIDAGVDFPTLLATLHCGDSIPPVEPRIGVRTRWLLGDLDHLFISLRRREIRRLTGRRIPRLFYDFLRSFFDGSRLEILRRDDWRPFLRELQLRWRS